MNVMRRSSELRKSIAFSAGVDDPTITLADDMSDLPVAVPLTIKRSSLTAGSDGPRRGSVITSLVASLGGAATVSPSPRGSHGSSDDANAIANRTRTCADTKHKGDGNKEGGDDDDDNASVTEATEPAAPPRRRRSIMQQGKDQLSSTENVDVEGTDTDESSAWHTWALHPQSTVRFYWDAFILLLMMHTCVVLPLSIAEFGFMKGVGWDVSEQLINGLFLLDLFINMHTGYVDEKSRTLIMDARLTRVYYLRSWFVPDLLATIPAELIVRTAMGAAGVARLSAGERFLLRCLRLLRVLRLMRLRRILKRLEVKSGLQTSTKTAIKFCAIVFLCSHWYCCAWYLLGNTILTAGAEASENITAFYLDDDADVPNTWLLHHDLYRANAVDQYVAALYWSLSTMSTIAYGDITPKSSIERMFSCFVMVTGTSVYAYGVASVVTLATGANENERNFMRRKDDLNRYMRQMHMPLDLKVALREYFMHFHAAMMTFNERSLLTQLSPHLQARVTNLANAGLIRQVPFFEGQEDRCITAVMLALTPNLFVPNEMICFMGEIGTDLYILKSGAVSVFVNTLTGRVKEIAQLRKGNFFGEMALVSGDGARRNANVKSVAYSIIYSMSNKDLLPVMDKFVSLKAAIEAVAEKRRVEMDEVSKRKSGVSGVANSAQPAAVRDAVAPLSSTAADPAGAALITRTLEKVNESFERICHVESKVNNLEEALSRIGGVVDETREGMVALTDAIALLPKATPNAA